MDVVAHRGLWGTAPENSLAAVQAALDGGLSFVEADIRASGDGGLFLLHDATLDRTTSLGGRLAALSAAQARRARLPNHEPLPLLDEALDLCHGRAVLCIDVKERAAGPPLLRALCEHRRRRGRLDAEVWSSDAVIVRHAAAIGVRTTLISHGVMRRGIWGLIWEAWEIGASGLSFYPADLEPMVAAACRNAGMPFLCGAPNDSPTWRYLVEVGARGIITDRPLACRALLRQAPAAARCPAASAPAPDAA